jgi:iron complex transport system substrate-binding protein
MAKPLRILSLAPTQTEILAALGLTQELLGITEDCDYPEEVRRLPRFGGWWQPDLPRVIEAAPDLICTFGQRQAEMAGLLRGEGLKVFHSDPGTVTAALKNIQDLAALTGTQGVALALGKSLTQRIQSVQERMEASQQARPLRVLRIMHWEPFITVGPGAFQHDVILQAGGLNVMTDGPAPYFVCNRMEVCRRDPEVIFFCEAHILDQLQNDASWQDVSAIRHRRIHVFDCGLTCRSGPRIVDMLEALASVLED